LNNFRESYEHLVRNYVADLIGRIFKNFGKI